MGIASDPGRPVAVAFGKPTDDMIQIHTVVTMGMHNAKPPDFAFYETKSEAWDAWVNIPLILKDSAGVAVKFSRNHQSSLIQDIKAGVFEFYLIGTIKQGADYTFDYIPRTADPEHYQYKFVAPTDAKPMKRVTFGPNY